MIAAGHGRQSTVAVVTVVAVACRTTALLMIYRF